MKPGRKNFLLKRAVTGLAMQLGRNVSGISSVFWGFLCNTSKILGVATKQILGVERRGFATQNSVQVPGRPSRRMF